MKPIYLLVLLFLLAGCAGSRIKPVEITGATEPERLAAALESYNRSGSAFRAMGEVRVKDSPSIGFGVRAVSGRAVRMDAMAFPAAKLVFSAACPSDGACEVYFPDDFVVYREKGVGFGGWLASLALGRVPLIGKATRAGFDPTGAQVLRYADDRGQWAEVIFAPGGVLPSRALYGESGSEPLLELVYSDFRQAGEVAYPGVVAVGGSKNGDEFVLGIDRFESVQAVGDEAFRLKPPQGVRIIETTGSGTWKRLGMFWIPKF